MGNRCRVQQKHALLLSSSLPLLICQTFSLFWFSGAEGEIMVYSSLFFADSRYSHSCLVWLYVASVGDLIFPVEHRDSASL